MLSCSNGAPTPSAVCTVESAVAVFSDANAVYIQSQDLTIVRFDRQSKSLTQFLAGAIAPAVAATDVGWLYGFARASAQQQITIVKIRKSDAQLVNYDQQLPATVFGLPMALDSAHIFTVAQTALIQLSKQDPTAAGVTIATLDPSLTVDGLAADGAYVFVSSHVGYDDANEIDRIALSDGTKVVVTTAALPMTPVAVVDGCVFWYAFAPGSYGWSFEPEVSLVRVDTATLSNYSSVPGGAWKVFAMDGIASNLTAIYWLAYDWNGGANVVSWSSVNVSAVEVADAMAPLQGVSVFTISATDDALFWLATDPHQNEVVEGLSLK